jgi:hypothetical protein
VLTFPHFRFLAYAEGTGEQVSLINHVADPVHGEFREDNGGDAFPLSLSDVSGGVAVVTRRCCGAKHGQRLVRSKERTSRMLHPMTDNVALSRR